MQELRLRVSEPDAVIAADPKWQREPVFSQQDKLAGSPIDERRWRLFWQADPVEIAQPGVRTTKSGSAFNSLIYLTDPFGAQAPHPVKSYKHRSVIASRIAKLRHLSSASGDPFNEASAKLIETACAKLATEVKPSIFLLPNGNLRAVWRNEERESIGVQFLPDGDLQYVILHRGRTKMLQALGIEEVVSDFASKVKSFGMDRLWLHGKR